MSSILMIRHGQACLGADDYDRLSPLGLEQAQRLGAYWERTSPQLDDIVVGPCLRHHQTLEAATAPLRATNGAALPPVRRVDALDEFPALTIMSRELPARCAQDPEMAAALKAQRAGDPAALELLIDFFEGVGVRYARGETSYDGVETFSDFRKRIEMFLWNTSKSLEADQTCAVFTSGGPVAASLGLALGLDDERVFWLSVAIRNGAWAELSWQRGRWDLVAFNVHPHLDEPRLLTVR